MKPLNPKDIKADQELALRLKTLQEERSGLLSRDSLPDNRELSEAEFAEQGLREYYSKNAKSFTRPKN